MFALVEAPAFDEFVPDRSGAAFIVSFLHHLTETRFCTDRGFLAFAVGLPEADIVEQLIDVIVKTLFAFLRAPDLYSVLDEPFHNERRFVRDTTDTVEHENEQNIELAFPGKFFYCLDLVAVLGAYFVTGNAVFLFLVYDIPAHLLGKSVTRLSLHRDIRFVIIVVIDLLIRGNTV